MPGVTAAELVLVPATVDGTVAMFLVPTNAPGITTARQQAMNHEPLFEMELDGVHVGDDALLGSLEQGAEILAWTLNRTTIAVCAVVSGVAEQAVRMTAQYTCDRKQFDRAIGTFQAVGQRMADCFIDMQGIELTMLQAATHLDEGRDDVLEVATAKFWAADGGNRIAHAALHIHGGISIDVDYADPPLLPVAEAVRVHPRLRHPRAPEDRQRPRRHPRLEHRTGVSERSERPLESRRFGSYVTRAMSRRRRTGSRSKGGPAITMRCSAPASR